MSTTSTTIYSGFHRKLKDRRLCWEDRLKIARYAWTTPAAFIPNKQQVLLDWLFGALLNKKKLKINDKDALYIWLTINDFVRSNYVRGLSVKSQLLSLRSSATQVMTDSLTRLSLTSPTADPKLISWMLGACHGVLASPPIAYLLTSRTKVLNVVLSSSLRLLLQMLKKEEEELEEDDAAMDVDAANHDPQQQQQKQHTITPQLKKVVEAFASAAIDAFARSKGRRGGDEKQILQFFLDEVIDVFLQLVVDDRLSQCSEGDSLRSKLNSLVDSVLFASDHKIHYDHFLDAVASKASDDSTMMEADEGGLNESASSAKTPKIPPLIKAVFDKLRHRISADPDLVASSVMTGLKKLNVIPSRRFVAATVLAESALTKSGQLSPEDVAVFDAVSRHVADDDLVDPFCESAKTHLHSVLGAVLACADDNSPTKATFSLLINLLKCDPHILDSVAVKAIGLTLTDENMCVKPDDISKERDGFFGHYIQLYKKLRRLDKFFLHLQSAVVGGLVKNESYVSGMSKSALKTIEEVGVDLPLGTALTIWENLNEKIQSVIEGIEADVTQQQQQLSTLLLIEIAFLQKLVLANHEHPESLSAQIHSCVVAMRKMEVKMRDSNQLTEVDLQPFKNCLDIVETTLRFYLPHRHQFTAVSPIQLLALNPEIESTPTGDQIAEAKSLILAPVNWLPYDRKRLNDEYVDFIVNYAVENVFLLDSFMYEPSREVQSRLRQSSIAFLKDETNHEIPNFASALTKSLIGLLAKDASRAAWANGMLGFSERIDLLLDLLNAVPHQVLAVSDLNVLVVQLFDIISAEFVEDCKEKVVRFVESLLTDFPDVLVKFENSSADLIPLLEKCRSLISRESDANQLLAFSRATVSIAVKLVKSCFRCQNEVPIGNFLEATLRLCKGMDRSDAMIQFLLPLYQVSWHGLQRLQRRSNPADDAKVKWMTFSQVVENTIDCFINDILFNDSEHLTVITEVAIVKTLLGTCFAVPLDQEVRDSIPIVRRMMGRLADIVKNQAEQLSNAERSALLECLLVVLRKPRFAASFRSGLNDDDLSTWLLTHSILKLLPPKPSPEVAKETPDVPAPSGPLPTETFSVLDRFLDDQLGDSSANPDVVASDDDPLDDRRSEISNLTSDSPAPDSSKTESSAPIVESILRCMLSIYNIEVMQGQGDENDGVVDKMISFISIENVDSDPRQLDLALRFCLDNLESTSSKPFSRKSKRKFVDAIQKLAVELKLRCKDDPSAMTTVERSVALSLLLCLSKFLAFNPKKKLNESEDPEDREIHLKPMALVAAEVLLALPIPADQGTDLSKTSSSEFFLRYAEVVNSMFVNHQHRVFSMAPTYFMTVDRLLKVLSGLCKQLPTANSADPADNQPFAPFRKRVRDCTNALLRLVTLFRSHKTEFSKLAPYWISHFTRALTSTSSFGSDARVLRDMNGCVFCLMDLLDEFGFDVLRTLLPSREKEILHKLKIEYETTFKFKGKI